LEDILVGAGAGGSTGDLCRWSNSADYLILKQEDPERVTQFHALTQGAKKMKSYQKGEVMLVVMVVMLVVVWLGSGRMGMMGHGNSHTEEHKGTVQQKKVDAPTAPASQEADGNRH